jgi:hypothetical protein
LIPQCCRSARQVAPLSNATSPGSAAPPCAMSRQGLARMNLSDRFQRLPGSSKVNCGSRCCARALEDRSVSPRRFEWRLSTLAANWKSRPQAGAPDRPVQAPVSAVRIRSRDPRRRRQPDVGTGAIKGKGGAPLSLRPRSTTDPQSRREYRLQAIGQLWKTVRRMVLPGPIRGRNAARTDLRDAAAGCAKTARTAAASRESSAHSWKRG